MTSLDVENESLDNNLLSNPDVIGNGQEDEHDKYHCAQDAKNYGQCIFFFCITIIVVILSKNNSFLKWKSNEWFVETS